MVTPEVIGVVATAFASLIPLAWVSVLPLPVAVSTTVAPLIGVPLASFTVTVTVALPPPAVSDVGATATVDSAADTTGHVTVTLAVSDLLPGWLVAATLKVPHELFLQWP